MIILIDEFLHSMFPDGIPHIGPPQGNDIPAEPWIEIKVYGPGKPAKHAPADICPCGISRGDCEYHR